MKFEKVGSMIHVSFKPGPGKRARRITTGQGNMADARAVVKKSNLKEIEIAAAAGQLTKAAIQTVIHGNQKRNLGGLVHEFEAWMLTASNKSPNTINATMSTINAFMSSTDTKDRAPQDLTEGDLKRYIDRNDETKLASRNVQLCHLRQLWGWMIQNSYTTKNLAKLVKVDKRKLSHESKEKKVRLPFDNDEYQRLLAVVDKAKNPFWKAATRIGHITGLRLGDVATLEWATFATAGVLVVHTRKTGKRLEFPMTDDLLLIMLELQNDPEDNKYVFPGPRLTYIAPDSRAQLSVQFSRLCQKAGIEGKTFHNLRHGRASEIYEQSGGDITAVQAALGHSDAKTSEGYVHV